MNKYTWKTEERDVVLLYPTDSLREQVADWAARSPGMCVRVVSPATPSDIRRELSGQSVVLVDATEHPAEAQEALEHVIEDHGTNSVALYTERMHEGLELFARLRGVLFLLGPTPQDEWGEVLGVFRRRHEFRVKEQPWLRLVRWPASA